MDVRTFIYLQLKNPGKELKHAKSIHCIQLANREWGLYWNTSDCSHYKTDHAIAMCKLLYFSRTERTNEAIKRFTIS